MKQENVPVYIADDGTRFDTEAECRAHEHMAKIEPVIDQYVAHLGKGETAGRRLTTILLKWERWTASRVK